MEPCHSHPSIVLLLKSGEFDVLSRKRTAGWTAKNVTIYCYFFWMIYDLTT
jgi:hypothetical protein